MAKQNIYDISKKAFLFSLVITLILVSLSLMFNKISFFSFLNKNSSQIMLFSIIIFSVLLGILTIKSKLSLKSKIMIFISLLIFVGPRFLVSIGGNGEINVSLYVFIVLIGTYAIAISLVHKIVREEVL